MTCMTSLSCGSCLQQTRSSQVEDMCVYMHMYVHDLHTCAYGVATISRLLKIISLLCKIVGLFCRT